MFSSKQKLLKRTPKEGTDRESYLSLLVDEFINSSSQEAKHQVLANLANFAYDPINYQYIRDVGVLDIFIYVIKLNNDLTLTQYASAGILNLCLDPLNVDYLIQYKGIEPLIKLLNCEHTDILINVVTTFIYLRKTETLNQRVHTDDIIKLISKHKCSNDKRLANVVNIFLSDNKDTRTK